MVVDNKLCHFVYDCIHFLSHYRWYCKWILHCWRPSKFHNLPLGRHSGRIAGFVRVLEILESPGICSAIFQFWKVLKICKLKGKYNKLWHKWRMVKKLTKSGGGNFCKMRKRCVEEQITCTLRLESGKSTGVLKKFWKTVAENKSTNPVIVIALKSRLSVSFTCCS